VTPALRGGKGTGFNAICVKRCLHSETVAFPILARGHFQRVRCHLSVLGLVATDVDGSPACCPQTGAIGLAFSGDVKSSTMVRAGAHNGQSRCEIHAFTKGQTLEGNEALIVVHREHTVELFEACCPEESISTKGPMDIQPLLLQRSNGR